VSVLTGFGTIEVSGFDAGDGKLTAGAAVAVLLFGGMGLINRVIVLKVFAVIAALFGAVVSVYDWNDVNDRLQSIESEIARASVGYGLYVCIAGFAAAAIGLLASMKDN
jgi:hypothetical protein